MAALSTWVSMVFRSVLTQWARLHVRPLQLWGLTFVLVVGVLAFIAKSQLPKSAATEWPGSTLQWLVWFGAIALLAWIGLLIFALSSLGRERLQVLAAMRRPLLVVVVAGCLLLLNDQCRELGISLMIGDGDRLRALYLLVALVYWALNNWHSARLGLWRATQNGILGDRPANVDKAKPNRRVVSSNTPWIFWGPRLLGVCAHLLAAASLGLAASKQPEFGSTWLRYPAALSAVLIIAALTYFVYGFDLRNLSERETRRGDAARRGAMGGTNRFRAVFLRSASFLFIVSTLLLGVAAGVYGFIEAVPRGFVVGTFAISESAVVYLTIISSFYRRNPMGPNASLEERAASDKKELRQAAAWTWALFVFGAPFAVWTIIDAPSVGRAFGSMVIAFFAFGALLATLNWFEWLTATVAKRIFGPSAKPHVFNAYVTAALVALCVMNAWLQPLHDVRRCEGKDCLALDERMNVRQAAEIWYEQAKSAYTSKRGGDEKVPLLIVATAGGGIRAAYWTAVVLDRIEKELAESGGARPYLFAISGVSGGSVGATAFAAALVDRDKHTCDLRAKGCTRATSFLADDFFAPALASWIFKDSIANVLPWSIDDRAAALEQAFEYASNGLLARPFLSFFNRSPKFEASSIRSTWSPILLLNATHEETGRRIIASQVLVERSVFVDALDELQVLKGDVRASTAAINSARFTYVSPAGNLGPSQGSIIDGGYYENFGALTALEIAREAQAELGQKVKLVMLMITSDPTLGAVYGDPSLDKSRTLVRIDRIADAKPCLVSATERDPNSYIGPNYLPDEIKDFENTYLNEFVAPLQGISKVREAHGNRAAAELAVQVCTQISAAAKAAKSAQPANAAHTDTAASSTGQPQIADALRSGGDVVAFQTQPAIAKPNLPFFAHVGMCQRDPEGDIDVMPPLGWVLSKSTRDGVDELVARCGNRQQLDELETALKPPASTAATAP